METEQKRLIVHTQWTYISSFLRGSKTLSTSLHFLGNFNIYLSNGYNAKIVNSSYLPQWTIWV